MSLPLSTTERISHSPEAALPQAHAAPAKSAPHAPRWLGPVLGVLAVVLLGGAGVYFRDPLLSILAKPETTAPQPTADPVVVLGKDMIGVDQSAPLKDRLRLEPVVREDLEYPLLNVTGYVMARLAPGKDMAESRWDFAAPEVATAYGDWLNARADVEFLEGQLKKTKDLVKVRVDFLYADYERKAKYAGGVVPERDVVAAKSDWQQADIQGKKDIFEADTGVKKAIRNRGLLERQLLQAGVDPEVVRKAHDDLVLVIADVPEAKVNLVKPGQPCEASFFGVPNKVFKGKVGSLGPSVNREKRTLRVTFELTSSGGKLLPGMFADIGLGTEARNVLTVPTEAILHAGHSDYVLKVESPGKYRVMEVKVDEPRPIKRGSTTVSCTPILDSQLTKNDQVIGAGAILLKPIMVKALAQ
jgi:hypothetical protein